MFGVFSNGRRLASTARRVIIKQFPLASSCFILFFEPYTEFRVILANKCVYF